jgi:hypothetical protein
VSVAIIKTSFGIVATIVAIALLQTTTALDAILLFAAAGEVPGTDIELTPAATMWTLSAIGAAFVLLVFSGRIVRMFRSWRETKQVAAEIEAVIAKPKPTRRKKAAKTATTEAKQPDVPVVVIKVPGKPGYLSRAFRAVTYAIRHGIALSVAQLPVIRAEVIARSQYAVGVLRLYLAYAWRWWEPRADRIGRYVIARLNKPQNIKPLLDLARSSDKVLAKWVADARKQVLRYKAKLNF